MIQIMRLIILHYFMFYKIIQALHLWSSEQSSQKIKESTMALLLLRNSFNDPIKSFHCLIFFPFSSCSFILHCLSPWCYNCIADQFCLFKYFSNILYLRIGEVPVLLWIYPINTGLILWHYFFPKNNAECDTTTPKTVSDRMNQVRWHHICFCI